MSKTKLKVLLVDDDSIYQYIASKTLDATGLTQKIITCSNGEEAYRFLEKNMNNPQELPDIILLDVNMPVMNGWEFLHAFKNLHSPSLKDIPIFLVTSSVNDADINYAQQFSNVQDYIVKPLVKEKLSTILNSVCVS
jgi:CheY-like chemotaxis protein